MAFEFPTLRQIADRMKTDVQSFLENANPFLRNSFLGAILNSFAARIFDVYEAIKTFVLRAIFPQTSFGIYLEEWGALLSVTRLAAEQARGALTIEGDLGVVIPVNTSFQSTTQNVYLSILETVVTDYNINIGNLTYDGATQSAKAVTPSPHGLAPGITITVTGAANPEYNVTDVLVSTVIDDYTFEYPIIGSPPDGDIGLVSYRAAWVTFVSSEAGDDQNLDTGEPLNITNPIVNLESTGYAQAGGAAGGKSIEDDDTYRRRVIEVWQSWKGSFNVSFVEFTTKSVSSDITRVWVFPFTIDDTASIPGTVEVYFTTDNLDVIIPPTSLVTEVQDKLNEERTVGAKVVVAAPTPLNIDFAFSSITPDTSSMRKSVEDQLIAFFQDTSYVAKESPETIIKESAYISAIYQTIDEETGDFIQDFTLTGPTGDILANRGELPVVGIVDF